MSMTVSSSAASAPDRREIAGNLSTGWLKLIALVSMFIDHTGKVLFNDLYEMRVLGRIAFPVYLWCMVVGFCHTRSVPKYLLRILIVFLISQPLYVLALDTQGHIGVILTEVFAPFRSMADTGFFTALGTVLRRIFLLKSNILLTLFLGLCALWGIREKKFLSQIWAPALAIVLATVLKADYGWKGVTFLMMLYAVRDTRPGIAAVTVAFFLFWGTSYRVTTSLFGQPINLTRLPDWLSGPLSAVMRLEAYGILSLPFLLVRFPKKNLKMPRWVSYALYPGHLVLIILLKLLVFGY